MGLWVRFSAPPDRVAGALQRALWLSAFYVSWRTAKSPRKAQAWQGFLAMLV